MPPQTLSSNLFRLILPCLALFGCNVPEPETTTGGTNIPASHCGRGVVVINSDYQSTNISLVSVDGKVLSSSFFSSASADTGLSSPLGGDVMAPTQPLDGPHLLFIDRHPASVLTWVDVSSATPVGQLSVATGFSANPHDVLVLQPDKAYVSRYEPNQDPGWSSFDQGDDILIIDPMSRTIQGRIDLHPAMHDVPDGFFARPDKLLRTEDSVLVLLGMYALGYLTSQPSRIATVDPHSDSVQSTLPLQGMHGCTAMALSPDRDQVVVACSGEFGGDSIATIANSGIVVLSTKNGVHERRRFPAAKFGQGPVGGTIAYSSDTGVVFSTMGQFDNSGLPARQDALIQLDTDSGAFEVRLQSEGEPFSFGDVRCSSTCNVCFLADASRYGGVLHRFSVGKNGSLEDPVEIIVDRGIGLPPRNLGWF